MKIKISIITAAYACIIQTISYAQNVGVAINANGAAPHSSSMLDINATNKGLLIPRVNLSDLSDNTTITTPATGLLVYNEAASGTAPNNVTPGFYFWAGSNWSRLNNSSSNLSANNGLTLAGSTIQLGGTLNSATDIAQAGFDFRFTGSGSVGIGTRPHHTNYMYQVQLEQRVVLLPMMEY